jgi:hypothetical protein
MQAWMFLKAFQSLLSMILKHFSWRVLQMPYLAGPGLIASKFWSLPGTSFWTALLVAPMMEPTPGMKDAGLATAPKPILNPLPKSFQKPRF